MKLALLFISGLLGAATSHAAPTTQVDAARQAQLIARRAAQQAAVAAHQQAAVALVPTAYVLKTTLVKYFGAGAETSRIVTKGYVSAFFDAKRQAGTITEQEVADVVALMQAFDAITQWTGDGTTWSFPWNLVP